MKHAIAVAPTNNSAIEKSTEPIDFHPVLRYVSRHLNRDTISNISAAATGLPILKIICFGVLNNESCGAIEIDILHGYLDILPQDPVTTSISGHCSGISKSVNAFVMEYRAGSKVIGRINRE